MFKFLWTAEQEEPEPTVTNDEQVTVTVTATDTVTDTETYSDAVAYATEEEVQQVEEPTASLGPPQTWDQAHLKYCQQHHLFVASLQKVLQSLPDGEEVTWTLPKVEQAVVVSTGDKQGMLQAILQQEKVQESKTAKSRTSGTPASSSSYRILSKVYGAVSSVVWKSDEDDDEFPEHVEWNQAGDHALGDEQPQQRGIVDWKDTILCLELITPSWHSLQTRLARVDPSPYLFKRADWKDWLRKDSDDNSMFSQLAPKDADLLLDLLITNRQAKVVSRDGKPELIALGATVDNNAVDAAVTIWDLNLAMQSTERQLEEWAVQIQECEKKALLLKQQGQPKLALHQMGRRKLLQVQLDSSAQIVLKLEQTKLAVWQAQSNTSLVDTLRSATKTLQDLRLSTPLEQVDTVQDDLQEELDDLTELQSTLVGHDTQHDDDEALLQELAELTLMDPEQEESGGGRDGDEDECENELALSRPVPPTGMVAESESDPKVAEDLCQELVQPEAERVAAVAV
jgi:hypothetical protein